MNSDEMHGKWNQFKGAVKQKWGKLTDDDIKQVEGNRDILVGKIQERYGITREKAEQEFNEWKLPTTGSKQEIPKRKVG